MARSLLAALSVARLSQSQVALRHIRGCTQERSLLSAPSVTRLSQNQVALRHIRGCTQERSLLLASIATRYSLGQVIGRDTFSPIEKRSCLPAPSVKQPLLHQMIYWHTTITTPKRARRVTISLIRQETSNINVCGRKKGKYNISSRWSGPKKNFLFCVSLYIYIFLI